MKIQNRNDYEFDGLEESDLFSNPIQQFANWLRSAELCDVPEPTAFALSTLDQNNFPDSRIVLLKEFDSQGFVFFTNYLSKKGRDLMQNHQASILFFWPQIMRQIRIQGVVEMIPPEQSEEYFRTRPLDSQLGALVSQQSSPLENRQILEDALEELKLQLGSETPRCPSWWGGYLLRPSRFEFWQGRQHRLHDRIVYELQEQQWQRSRLYP